MLSVLLSYGALSWAAIAYIVRLQLGDNDNGESHTLKLSDMDQTKITKQPPYTGDRDVGISPTRVIKLFPFF